MPISLSDIGHIRVWTRVTPGLPLYLYEYERARIAKQYFALLFCTYAKKLLIEVVQTQLARMVCKKMEVKPTAKVGLLMFGLIFAWIALFLMLALLLEQLPTGIWAGSVFLVIAAVFAVASSLFLGVAFGAEIVE